MLLFINCFLKSIFLSRFGSLKTYKQDFHSQTGPQLSHGLSLFLKKLQQREKQFHRNFCRQVCDLVPMHHLRGSDPRQDGSLSDTVLCSEIRHFLNDLLHNLQTLSPPHHLLKVHVEWNTERLLPQFSQLTNCYYTCYSHNQQEQEFQEQREEQGADGPLGFGHSL